MFGLVWSCWLYRAGSLAIENGRASLSRSPVRSSLMLALVSRNRTIRCISTSLCLHAVLFRLECDFRQLLCRASLVFGLSVSDFLHATIGRVCDLYLDESKAQAAIEEAKELLPHLKASWIVLFCVCVCALCVF